MKNWIFILSFVALMPLQLAAESQSLNDEALKKEILELAKSNTANIATRPVVRKKLNSLVQSLTQNKPQVSEAQWAQYAPGSWRQIWADEADNGPSTAPKQNFEKIFQFVTPAGRAVNFGERIFPDGTAVTLALEAKGSVAQNIQTTTIIASFSRGVGLSSGESLEELSHDILSGELKIFNEYPTGEFPNGPINAVSDLKMLFLDKDLKIGTAPNVFTGNSEMFVLERVSSVQ